MAGDYPIKQIGELASSISDTHKFGKEQLIFLNTSDILHGKFLHRTYSAVKDWPGQAKKSIRKNDILFSEIRPANGRWAYVDEDADDFVVSTKLMVIRAKQDRLFPKFLYQFLTSSEITKWLQHLAESRSGTFPQITFDQVATLELPLPPLAEQKAIAAVLGALDDKIELNRRMNATLEAMARALFQSWFVNFDPVRQNMDTKPSANEIPEAANGLWFTYAIECEGGSVYIGQTDNLRRRWKQHGDGTGAEWTKGHPPVALVFWETHHSLAAAVAREAKLKSGSGREWLKQKIAERTSVRLPAGEAGAKLDGRPPAALFPDSFQDSPIGPVPKGWKVERFDAHITADRGLSYKGEGLRDDRTGLPMHNLNSVYEGGGYKHEGLKYYGGEYREKHLLNPGDMIVTNTEQGFDHLLIGHAAIVPRCYGPKGIYSHHIYRVRHKPTSPFSPHYLVELFNNRRWHYWISGFSNGTTINMLPMDALEMPMLVVPPVELVKKFTALAEAAHIQVEDNKQQSRTLATLRDTLLPKLLSGELSVEIGSHNQEVTYAHDTRRT